MRVRRWILAAAALTLLASGCEKKRGHRVESDLCWAAYEGDIETVRSMIARGVSVHVTNSAGQTPLHNAAKRGRLEVVELLVCSGAQIDAPDNHGFTPAMLAMAENHKPVVEYLVEEGAGVDFCLAAYLGDVAKVKEFIDAGADVNTKGPYAWLPLHYAAFLNHIDVAKLLIAAGADLRALTEDSPHWTDDVGQPALYHAIEQGHVDMVNLLIDGGADVNAKHPNGTTPLYLAICRGKSEVVRLLIAKGADVNALVEHYGIVEGPMLGVAIQAGNLDIVESLIAGGADVTMKDESGWSLVHIAVTSGGGAAAEAAVPMDPPDLAFPHGDLDRYNALLYAARDDFLVRTIGLLVAHGADVDAKDEDGLTPLHCAAYHGYRRAVALLLERGADVNARIVLVSAADGVLWERDLESRMEPGVTPLHEAVAGWDPNVADLLLAHGAKVNAVDDSGNTPLHYAVARTGVQVVRLLIAAGADVNARNNDGAAPLVIALRNGRVTMAKTLIAAGAENVVMKIHFPKIHAEWEMQWRGSLLLHGAARIGRNAWTEERFDVNEPNQPNWPREWMELLLANGADPNERDRKGDTPLHAGILERNEEAARLLVAHGVDVKARNLAGSTALHYAASEGLTGVISLLLTKGVDVNAQDNDGDTPLHGAALHGHKKIVELLLAHGADVNVRNNQGQMPLDRAVRRGHEDVIELLTAKKGPAATNTPGNDAPPMTP